MNSAVQLLRTAADAGAVVCFANPGTTEMALVDALDQVPEMRAILCLFEGVCTGAADGYGRMTGRPALTLLHLGPGFANGIANLHNARRASSPVVNLIGDHATWHLAADAPLTSDIESLARPVSPWLRTSTDAASLPADMADALAAATGPPGRVASLILPADLQIGDAAGPVVVPSAEPRRAVSAAAIEACAKVIEAARDGAGVSLLLGADALGERGLRAVGRLALLAGVRLLAETFPARWERGAGLPAPQRLPYLPEQATARVSEDAQLLLAGARDPVAFFGYTGLPSAIAPDTPRVTLASPDEDSAAALEALADVLGAPVGAAVPARSLPDRPADGPLDPGSIGALLARHVPADAIVVDEAATSSAAFYAHSEASARHSLLTLTGGAIGTGLPLATGAAVACPERKVIAFQADGSGAYTLQALWTQAREDLDVTTLLCSNRAYRILQIELGRAGIATPGAKARSLTQLDQPEIDWSSLARGFGVPAERVETTEALDRALAKAFSERGPRLIEMVF